MSRAAPISRTTTLLGWALFACAFLPLTPGGRNFVQVVVEAFTGGAWAGLIMLFAAGSPFLFGLACGLGGRFAPESSAGLVRMPVTMMHSYTLLVAWALWRADVGVATLPLLLFVAASALRLISVSASQRASGSTASFAWYVRTGGMFIAAVAGWLVLQRAAGLEMGIAVPVAGVLAALLAARGGTSNPTPAASADAVDEA